MSEGRQKETVLDGELLCRDSAGADQEAFAELFRRHGVWLYCAARRQLGDSHLAEDATQAVFLVLARRAERLRRYAYLDGWLFLTLSYCIREIRRHRSQAAKREQEAASMRPESVEQAPWDEIAPLLESVVGRLGKADRDAVLLRFYEQKPLAEVGRLMGVSEEAARKRVDRAVGKLRGMLEMQGVTGTSAGLSAVLVGNVVEQSPALLVDGVMKAVGGGNVVAGGIAKGAAKMMAWGKVRTLIGAAALVVASGISAGQIVGQHPLGPAAAPAPVAAATQPLPQLLQRARFVMRDIGADGKAKLYQLLWEGPDKIRADRLLEDGSVDPQEVPSIRNGGRSMRADPRGSRLYVVEDTVGSTGDLQLYVFLASLPDPSTKVLPNINMNWGTDGDIPVRWQTRGTEAIAGRQLNVFEALRTGKGGDRPLLGEQKVLLSFADNGQCRRVVFTSQTQRTEVDVDPNPVFAADAFELKGPPGYTDVRQGVFPRLDPAIREVADQYYRAREGITRYQMVAYTPSDPAYPHYRNVRDGERWRLDELDLGAMIADKEFPRGGRGRMLSPLELHAVLERACQPEMQVQHLVMPYEGQLAQVGFNYSTQDGGPRVRAGWVVPMMDSISYSDPEKQRLVTERRLKTQWYKQAPQELVGQMAHYDLRELGWPAWWGDVLVAPHGWDLGTPPPTYYRLAVRTDRPGLIGIRAVRQCEIRDMWIDPAKDYLCAYAEEVYDRAEPWKADPSAWDGQRYYAEHKPDDQVHRGGREIAEYGRTEQGKWYPVSLRGGAHIILDTTEAPDPALFEWPAGAPKPGQ